MIYRAVIVDDESYIADSTAVFLRSDCPWDMEIQVFYDPREALESIRSQKTDIVITDIRMPEVDGLEMLRQVSEFWPMCQVILLTAHAQFEYVYQAVGRPSADYVLKQDGYEALLAAVNRAVERINTTQVEQNILSTATERAQAALPWLQREFVLDLVHGAPYDGASLAATARQLAMEVDVEKPLGLLTVFLHDQSPNETLFERTQRSGALFLLAKEFLAEDAAAMSVQLDANRMLWLWQFGRERTRAQLEGVLEGVQTAALNQLGMSASFLYSEPCESWRQYPAAYNRMGALLSQQALGGARLWLLCAERAEPDEGDALKRQSARAIQWSSAYKIGDPAARGELAALLEQMSSMRSVHDRAYMQLYLQISLSLAQMLQRLDLTDEQRGELLSDRLYDAKSHATPAAAAAYLHWLSERLHELRRENSDDTIKAQIYHVQQYIREHYDEDVSLTRLAEHVHVNAAYLSRMFKQATGENLADTIRQVRLDKARELLSRPDLRIHEVSSRLGFQTPAYFSYFFRKNTGMTPREYRDSAVGESPNGSIER